MRTRRVFVIILAVLSLFAGLLTGQRIYYGTFMVVCLVPALSLIFTLVIFLTIKYSESISSQVVQKGDEVILRVHLQNSIPLPIPRLELKFNTKDSSIPEIHQTKEIWLKPLGDSITDIVFNAEYSGFFTIGLVGITFFCPFGLYSIYLEMSKFRYYLPSSILVLPLANTPSHISLDSRMNEGSSISSLQSVDKSVQVDYPKAYTYGDTLHDIHWKLSIRTSRLFSKKYEETSHPNLLLILDSFNSGLLGLEGIQIKDIMVEAAASVVNFALSSNISVELITYSSSKIKLRGNSISELNSFLNCLARVSLNGTINLCDVLRVEPLEASEGVLVITTDISVSLFDELVWLKARDIFVKVLCVTLTEASLTLQKTIRELTNLGIRSIHLSLGDDILEAVAKL